MLLLASAALILVQNITCCKANFHSSLPMSQHFKLRQGHFVGDAHRVWSLIPLIPDVPHRITNWGNHKHTSNVLVSVFRAYVQDPPITSRSRAPVDCIIVLLLYYSNKNVCFSRVYNVTYNIIP